MTPSSPGGRCTLPPQRPRPAMPGTFSRAGRGLRCWPPPWSQGRIFTSSSMCRKPALGTVDLVRRFGEQVRSWPFWGGSQAFRRPGWRPRETGWGVLPAGSGAPMTSTGSTAPISLFTYMMETRMVSGRMASSSSYKGKCGRRRPRTGRSPQIPVPPEMPEDCTRWRARSGC